VAHELLNSLQGLAPDREPTAEGVAQGVKNDLVSVVVDAGIQAKLVDNAPEGISDLVFLDVTADSSFLPRWNSCGNTY